MKISPALHHPLPGAAVFLPSLRRRRRLFEPLEGLFRRRRRKEESVPKAQETGLCRRGERSRFAL